MISQAEATTPLPGPEQSGLPLRVGKNAPDLGKNALHDERRRVLELLGIDELETKLSARNGGRKSGRGMHHHHTRSGEGAYATEEQIAEFLEWEQTNGQPRL